MVQIPRKLAQMFSLRIRRELETSLVMIYELKVSDKERKLQLPRLLA